MRLRSGSIVQSGLSYQPEDYGHQHITFPVLGIVLNVFYADDSLNVNGTHNHGRGSHLEAKVLVVNDGTDSPWILPNVVVTPSSGSGYDNFNEDVPHGVSGTIDESQLDKQTIISKLDGDWCVVGFIGGSDSQPFIMCWWPHPANIRDTATRGLAQNTIFQGIRWAKRFQGSRFVITSEGTVFVDTSEANQPLKKGKRPAPGDNDGGGDINVTVKESRALDLQFNPPVFNEDEPDFLWTDHKKQERLDTSTHVRFTKDEINAIAGEMVNIIAKRKDIVLSTPEGNIYFGEGANERLVLGEMWLATMRSLIDATLSSNVPTAWGPSGPIAAGAGAAALNAVKAQLETNLSEFIYAKKSKA